jgi:hypothetical protein
MLLFVRALGWRKFAYLRTLLDKEHPHPLIVLTGDLNDGPGADFFEVRMSLCARVGGDRVHLRAGCVCYV